MRDESFFASKVSRSHLSLDSRRHVMYDSCVYIKLNSLELCNLFINSLNFCQEFPRICENLQSYLQSYLQLFFRRLSFRSQTLYTEHGTHSSFRKKSMKQENLKEKTKKKWSIFFFSTKKIKELFLGKKKEKKLVLNNI